jgi:hypothetical protein
MDALTSPKNSVNAGFTDLTPASKVSGVRPHVLPFLPFIERPTCDPHGPGRWSRSECISMNTIKKWLHLCHSAHGAHCEGTKDSASGWNGPIWLIDVEDRCLVEASPEAEYVALSYVWGGDVSSASTTRSNVDVLQIRNGLYDQITDLPQVIIEAIELVKSLSMRYLWIDRFCIVQDDGIAKRSQIKAMGSIYANAHFTIVAAENDNPADGLYGSRPIDTSNSSKSSTWPSGISNQEMLTRDSMQLTDSKWFSRGWTMQEYLFSRRKVVFHNNTATWECLCASWYEEQCLDSVSKAGVGQRTDLNRMSGNSQSEFHFEGSPWPNMARYARLVSMFNRRDLTYPEDVFDAFAGMLTHLSRIFPGGFISGLPQMCFDAALLWQPWAHMPRRIAKKSDSSAAILPSWSWAGWQGMFANENDGLL